MSKIYHPNTRDLTLHHLSCQMARVYVGLYNDESDKEVLDDLMQAIRNVRRHIRKDLDGDRHGAREYHSIISGEQI